MEKWIGETENLINASEAGLIHSIERQRKDLAYRQELEEVLISIYNDYTKEEIESRCSKAVGFAWELGKRLEERLKQQL
jgi:hypothetical protein